MIFDQNTKEKEILKMCRCCFMCRHACPVFLATKMDADTPRGHALLISRIDEGLSKWTADVVDKIYRCSQCGLCRELCEFHWEEDTLIQSVREILVKLSLQPYKVKDIAYSLIEHGTVYNESKTNPGLKRKTTDQISSDVLYFADDVALCKQPEIIENTKKILNFLMLNWVMLEKEGSTGIELFELGYPDEAKIAAGNLVERIKKIGPKVIITGSPHAYKAFKKLYPQWGIDGLSNIEIYHIVEYLDKKIKDGELKLTQNSNHSMISYHDPCHLGRGMGVYDAPRNLIKTVTGEPPVELIHNKNEAECCGAGSVMYLTNPDISNKVAQNRVASALQEKAEIVVTACPNCKMVLMNAATKMGCNLRIIDIVELISSHLDDNINLKFNKK